MSEQSGPPESHAVVSRDSGGMLVSAAGLRGGLGLKLLVGVVVLVAVVVALLVSGYLAVVWKQPAKRVVVVNKQVCGDDMVRTYNDASINERRGSNNDFSIDKAGLDKLKSRIMNSTGYQNDPTCQTILLMTAVYDEDYKAAKVAYSAIDTLHGRHQYANSGLITGMSLSSYGRLVQELAPASNNANSQGPQGGA